MTTSATREGGLRRRLFGWLAALSLLVLACGDASTADPAPPVTLGSVDCETVPVRETDLCHAIDVGGTTVRYVLFEPEGSTGATVLMDPGGPGLSSLAGTGIGQFLATSRMVEHLDGYAFLMVEEPWVTADHTDACRTAGRQHLAALRDGAEPGGLEPWRECLAPGRHGWSPARYREVVGAIAERHELDVDGFVGASFAAARLAYLDGDTAPDWALLANPLPPGMELREVLAHQAESATAVLGGWADAGDVVGQQIDTRSVPVAEIDVVAAAYQVLGQGGFTGPAGPGSADVGILSDLYTGRYGDGAMSLSRLAYFEELCPYTAGAEAAGDPGLPGPTATTAAFGRAYHRPCAALPGGPDRPASWPDSTLVCVVQAPADQVLPAERVQALAGGLGATVLDAPAAAGHADLAILTACAEDERFAAVIVP